MDAPVLIWTLLSFPALCAGICLALRSPRQVLVLVSVGGALLGCAGGRHRLDRPHGRVRGSRPRLALPGRLVRLPPGPPGTRPGHRARSTPGAISGTRSRRGHSTRRSGPPIRQPLVRRRRSHDAVLTCNNLGLMWVGIEATTLLTAFLISVHVSPLSLEATWKYLVVCSVGVAFAFVGHTPRGRFRHPTGPRALGDAPLDPSRRRRRDAWLQAP